jgi:FKBP-type peptidyl-prolyl cis-trans isomerase
MKRQFIPLMTILALLLSLPACGQENENGPPNNQRPARNAQNLAEESERLGYALGLEIGEALRDLKEEIELDALLRGIEDSILEREPIISREEAEAVKQSFLQRLQERQAEEMAALAAENLEISKEFLAENQKREEVITTDSGLQYTILRKGDGPRPALDDMVMVHYQGMRLDGTVFDSSYAREEPALLIVSDVIPGWVEVLQLMQTGSHYRLYIPPDLAYGASGAEPLIGPNEVLIFEIELLDIIDIPINTE